MKDGVIVSEEVQGVSIVSTLPFECTHICLVLIRITVMKL